MSPSLRILAVLAATIAAALTAAAGAAAAGLTIEPAIMQKTASPGRVGVLTVVNGTDRAMRIAVTPRPWVQQRSGKVAPDRRRSLSGVRVGVRALTLAAGQRRGIGVRLVRMPAARSVYGSIEVLGTPRGRGSNRGVAVRYRLISSLRLDPRPAARRLRVAAGAVRVRQGRPALALRNRGNSAYPIAGDVRVAGPGGTLRTSLTPTRVLPGSTVDLRLNTGRLPAGRYTAAVTLRQAGHRLGKVVRRFEVG